MMTLILQLNGDLPERFPTHDRRLYIFTCKSKTCRRKEGSIRAIRAVRAVQLPEAELKQARSTHERAGPQEDRSQKKPLQNLGNMIFNSSPQQQTFQNANPFSAPTSQVSNPFSTSTQATPPNPFRSLQTPSKPQVPPSSQPIAPSTLSETFAQKVRLSSPPPPPPPSPHEPWPPNSDTPSPYPSYHLDADFETLDAPHPPSSTPSSARIMEIDDPPSTASKDEDPDAFESPSLDKTFRRFADRLAQNPMQILRYEYAGSPLLYSKSDPVGKLLLHTPPRPTTTNKKITTTSSSPSSSRIPPCQHCTAPRVFELQLTPQAIAELEADEVSLDGMDWGTVILGVCAADCVPRGEEGGRGTEGGRVGYLEEWVGVQWEEMGGGGGGGGGRR